MCPVEASVGSTPPAKERRGVERPKGNLGRPFWPNPGFNNVWRYGPYLIFCFVGNATLVVLFRTPKWGGIRITPFSKNTGTTPPRCVKIMRRASDASCPWFSKEKKPLHNGSYEYWVSKIKITTNIILYQGCLCVWLCVCVIVCVIHTS